MVTKNIKIENIPAMLWGEKSNKIIIAVHGNMSSKSDIPIKILAEEAVPHGYQVLSFDLPEHGDRKNLPTLCTAQNCVIELEKIMNFAQLKASSVSLWANSIGAYFSLLALKKYPIKQALFLSPVINMESIIQNMMNEFGISEETLFKEKEIKTQFGQILYYDYYKYVKENPIEKWDISTAILCGKKDNFCEHKFVLSFAKKFSCSLCMAENSEHYFHTEEDLNIYRSWIKNNIK